jgi:hypothetical protein
VTHSRVGPGKRTEILRFPGPEAKRGADSACG